MIKIEGSSVEIDSENLTQALAEITVGVLTVAKEVISSLPEDVEMTNDDVVVDIFKSLRFAALTEDGLSQEEALRIINEE